MNRFLLVIEFNEEIRQDSGYSSNQERLLLPPLLYQRLFECHSGYHLIQSDFLTAANVSSLHSTTDEAYESEPTTISSSLVTTHVHPDLEHEFEYPSPPPPVPDRRLKPAHLKTPPPPAARPRLIKHEIIDSNGYTTVEKIKSAPLTALPLIVTGTFNESTSTRTMSCRHYCGSIPVNDEPAPSTVDATSIKPADHAKVNKHKEKRHSKTLSCLHSSAVDDRETTRTWMKSSISSLNKTKTKKQTTKEFDEATNGLAIRLPAPPTPTQDAIQRHNLNRFVFAIER